MPRSPVILLLALALPLAALTADWPQWRGPLANGVAPDSPKLAESWPKDGPPLVWKSDKVPGAGVAGWGSVAVAGGRVCVYLNVRSPEPITTRTLRDDALRRLGWTPDKPPAELLDQAEQARASEVRQPLKGKDLEDWIKQWLEAKVPKEQQKYAGWLQQRLRAGAAAMPLALLDQLATLKDKEFAAAQEFEAALTEKGCDEARRKEVLRVVPTTRDIGHDQVLCLEAATGKQSWQAKFPGQPHGQPCSSTPCLVGERVYVTGSAANVYCLDAKTGDRIWAAKSKGKPATPDCGSPLVVDGMVVLLAGTLVGLKADTGELAWEQKAANGSHNSPALWRQGARTLVVCNGSREVIAVDPQTGEVVWKVPGGGGWSSAAISGDLMAIYGANANYGVATFRLPPADANPAGRLKFADRGASPLVYQDLIYTVGGGGGAFIRCLTAAGELRWEEKLPGNTEIASPVAADGKILAPCGNSLLLYRAGGEKAELLAKANLKVETCTSPALVAGKVYLRLTDAVACYDLTAK